MTKETTMIPAADVEALFYNRDGHQDSETGWVRICVVYDSASRWETHHTLVMRDPDGRYWGVAYSLGKTEEQENTFPWQSGEDVVEAFRLYPHRVTSVEYRGTAAPVGPSTLAELQRWPKRSEDVTAPKLLRELALSARVCEAKVSDAAATGGREFKLLAAEYGATWGMVALLRRLIAVSPSQADDAAVELYESWEDGANMSELLYEWLVEAGLDLERIQLAYERARDRT